MKSIPVIGIPIVNGTNWLVRLINSIDYNVDNLFIVNNSANKQITKELEEIKNTKYLYIKNIYLTNLPGNIGCAGAWNLIIKSYLMAPYWIICNHDIAFTPGWLENMLKKAENPKIGIVFSTAHNYLSNINNEIITLGSWDIFLIKDWTIQKFGLFDENLYPAYSEDIDYLFRTLVDPIEKTSVELPYYHGETMDYAKSGGQTHRTNPELKDKIDFARYLNENAYMNKKWGPGWHWLDIYKHPFNKPDFDLKISFFDLYFARNKYLGF
jgi:hypothetical protein